MSDSFVTQWTEPARFLCPWDFPGKNTGVGYHFLLQGIFLTKGLKPSLLHWSLWPPDLKNWLIRKDPDAGKDWGQEEKGTTEDEMVGWHHWLDGHEFEQAPGVGDGHGGLMCCSPCVRKELDMTKRLNWLTPALAGGFFTTEPPGKPSWVCANRIKIYCFADQHSWGLWIWCLVLAHLLTFYCGQPI